MQDIDNSNIPNANNDEIDLWELFQVLINGKWIIISLTTFVSIFAVVYSLSLPNIYESKTLLVSSSPESQSGLSQKYGSLANIAGIDLTSGGSESNSVQAFQKLSSLSFFETNILPNIFLPNLMAFDSWNSQGNLLEYDKEIYDITSNIWVRDFSYPERLIPSAQESFAIFSKHLSIGMDKNTNFMTLKVKHQSPYIAQKWAKLYIDQINKFYRKKDKDEALKAVNYLNTFMAKANLSEIKQSIATLLQQETQKLTLIEANEFYVYEYIDPPAVMEKKSEPRRSTICILAALLGAMLSVIAVLFRHYVFNKEFAS